jgi:hypothetical protein
MDIRFISGFLHGAIFIVIIGLLLELMNKASGTIKQRNQTLDRFSEASRSKLTPAKIFWKSIWAMFVWFFWLLILLAFIAVMANIIQRELTGG